MPNLRLGLNRRSATWRAWADAGGDLLWLQLRDLPGVERLAGGDLLADRMDARAFLARAASLSGWSSTDPPVIVVAEVDEGPPLR